MAKTKTRKFVEVKLINFTDDEQKIISSLMDKLKKKTAAGMFKTMLNDYPKLLVRMDYLNELVDERNEITNALKYMKKVIDRIK